MSDTVLITGGFGFLGRSVAARCKAAGYRVVGIGRGDWSAALASSHGFDVWINANISVSNLASLAEDFGLIVHCAGNASVGFSLHHPLQDFDSTVRSSAELLEFVRLCAPGALLVYPSSAGVYGAKADAPIKEADPPNPISPYGFHKKMAEDLLTSYARSFGIHVAIIRFFSIYGSGLARQLLWDASTKLRRADGGAAVFWGTGDETRDWICSPDAAELILAVARLRPKFTVLNGASGVRCTVKQTLELLSKTLGSHCEIVFNNLVRAGDPRFYHADISAARALGWEPQICLPEGIASYVRWFDSVREKRLD